VGPRPNTKKRPDGLTAASTARDVFTAYENVATSEALYDENLKAIDDLLTKKHGFALSEGDLHGIEYVYGKFYDFGPGINYTSSGGGYGYGNSPTYWDLLLLQPDVLHVLRIAQKMPNHKQHLI